MLFSLLGHISNRTTYMEVWAPLLAKQKRNINVLFPESYYASVWYERHIIFGCRKVIDQSAFFVPQKLMNQMYGIIKRPLKSHKLISALTSTLFLSVVQRNDISTNVLVKTSCSEEIYNVEKSIFFNKRWKSVIHSVNHSTYRSTLNQHQHLAVCYKLQVALWIYYKTTNLNEFASNWPNIYFDYDTHLSRQFLFLCFDWVQSFNKP